LLFEPRGSQGSFIVPGRGQAVWNAETTQFYVALAGAALTIVGLLWLIAVAFRAWGFAVLLFPPLGIVFALKHGRAAAGPIIATALGIIVAATPILYNRLMPVDLGPREKMVGNELHITLTGWDQHDYSIVASRPKVVVLQMANPDVTDRTLAHLRGMSRLRELDLNGTQVGDGGLPIVADLAALQSLRLRDTKITDEGFRRWLAPMESLRQLDLRGTQVTRESGKAWRDAVRGRRLLQ
jgi:hypothetical protein